MFKKITLLTLVVLSTSTGFVACSSSDDATEQTQNSQYNINPPTWLQKKWILTGASSPNYTTIEYTSNDIRNYTTFDATQSWKVFYESLKEGNLELEEAPKFSDVSKSENYYEAQYTSGFETKGTVDINWKIYKISSDKIRVVETSQSISGTHTLEKEFEIYVQE